MSNSEVFREVREVLEGMEELQIHSLECYPSSTRSQNLTSYQFASSCDSEIIRDIG